MKSKDLQPRLFCPAKLSFKMVWFFREPLRGVQLPKLPCLGTCCRVPTKAMLFLAATKPRVGPGAGLFLPTWTPNGQPSLWRSRQPARDCLRADLLPKSSLVLLSQLSTLHPSLKALLVSASCPPCLTQVFMLQRVVYLTCSRKLT